MSNIYKDYCYEVFNAEIKKENIDNASLNAVSYTHLSAGNANTKYIIIGTICLVLAIAVVVAAYFLIKNMK